MTEAAKRPIVVAAELSAFPVVSKDGILDMLPSKDGLLLSVLPFSEEPGTFILPMFWGWEFPLSCSCQACCPYPAFLRHQTCYQTD